MTPLGRGFLLLTSHLGNPERRPLTPGQLGQLASRVHGKREEQRALEPRDLQALGYGREQAEHMAALLSEEALLNRYLEKAAAEDCVPVTRAEEGYPLLLRRRLGSDCPGCLWARGNLALLNTPAVSLVGSRDLREENRAFAERVGREAARQGLTLVSGNARGADRAAQDACLNAGGNVISVVADGLSGKNGGEKWLFLSEEDFDAPFTAQRALHRNRIIHCLGRWVFVAQASFQQGGTWDGTARNLRRGWSAVACYDDGSEAARALIQMGAYPAREGDLWEPESREPKFLI